MNVFFRNDEMKQQFINEVLEVIEHWGEDRATVSFVLAELRGRFKSNRWTGIGSQYCLCDILTELGFTVYDRTSKNGRRKTAYVKV